MQAQERQLVAACLADEPGAWECFYKNFAALIGNAARKAASASRDGANLGEDVGQGICERLYDRRGILQEFLKQRVSLKTFLTRLVYQDVRRARQKQKRHPTHGLDRPSQVPEAAREDWLDRSRLAEFEATLPPELLKFCRALVAGNGASPGPASGNERQLKHRLLKAWREFDQNR
jgi:hypothetical protein